MKRDQLPDSTSTDANLTTALVLGRARHRGRPFSPPARTLLASRSEQTSAVVAREKSEAIGPMVNEELFLTIDDRFGTPIHVFLELDPTGEPGFPGFRVRFVTLESALHSQGLGAPARMAIGQDPRQFDRFRMFATDRAVAGAGFIMIEPRYIGPNWPAYLLAFRPGGEKPGKRSASDEQGKSR